MAEFLLRLHLPGVQITQESAAFAGGTLVHVAFDEWYRLDGTHEYAESKYARNRPLFWEGMSDAADPTHAGRAQARALHRLFLLHPWAPAVTSPLLSTFYMRMRHDGLDAWMRCVGYAEREWIVFGGVPSFHFEPGDLAMIADIGELLDEVPENRWQSSLVAALDTLERTARPEYEHDVGAGNGLAAGFVAAVAACEGLVAGRTAPPDASLTDTFAHRLAALIPTDEADRAPHRAELAEIYRLRSRLVHGRLALADLDAHGQARLHGGRRLLRNACIATLSELADG